MEIVFKTQLLANLYENKKVDDKRFKSNVNLVKSYIRTVNKLKSASKVEQLYQMTSLNYEALSGDRNGFYSVRINDQYRIIFEEVKENEKVKVLALEEISNHYE